MLLATFRVTSVGDDGPGTLRQAIIGANESVGLDSITFEVGKGPITIRPTSELPTITDPVVIDGRSQPGFASTPIVELDGSMAGTGSAGLRVVAGDSVVRGLAVNRFDGSGIRLERRGGNRIVGNFLGLTTGGDQAPGNAGDGIGVYSANNTIGGIASIDRNVISGNGQSGILNTTLPAVGPGGQPAIYRATDLPLPLEDPGETTSSIVVGGTPDDRAVASVRVNLTLTHTFDEDLTLTLISPDGTRVVLSDRNGGTGDNYINTTFDDQAAESILDAGPPYTGTFRPEFPLSDFVGVDPDGPWTLEVSDGAVGDTGIFRNWSLTLQTGAVLPGVAAGDNSFINNRIGTDVTGSIVLGNGEDGISIIDVSADTIGGAATGMGNLISGNGGAGVGIESSKSRSSGIRLLGNMIGTDRDGLAALPNDGVGVLVLDAGSNSIGGRAPGEGNLISGNTLSGIAIGGAGSTDNRILGNRIGTDAPGSSSLANGQDGVYFFNDASANVVGGVGPGSRNLISGNKRHGIEVFGGASRNLIQGNYIGTDITGSIAIGNGNEGVELAGDGNLLGGTSPGAGNLISGNSNDGVEILGHDQNTVQGNLIGTDATGTRPLGNRLAGIAIRVDAGGGSDNNLIGGTELGARNVIAAGDFHGIVLTIGTGNLIQGNYIGTDITGTRDFGFASDGIRLFDGGNTVGGLTPGAGNLISANRQNGITAFSNNEGDFSGTLIAGNLIGTDAGGTAALPNRLNGIRINAARDITIGGTTTSARNVISGNLLDGINLVQEGFDAGTGLASRILMQGNFIGVDAAGLGRLGNGGAGIRLSQSGPNTIGGTATGAGNVISANSQEGISIEGATSVADEIEGNIVGLSADGSAALGNTLDGIAISGARDTIIRNNVVSGNGSAGVALLRSATGTTLRGNLIGTDRTGSIALGNSGNGVRISESPGNSVGGEDAGARNVISGNGSNGVFIDGGDSRGIAVQGNIIGTDAAGGIGLGNAGNGVTVADAPEVRIGVGTSGAGGNLISGNSFAGVFLSGLGAAGALIVGNRIGSDITGSLPIGNVGSGIVVLNVPRVLVGGFDPSSRNLVSGNLGHGIEVSGNLASGLLVAGNIIGADPSGFFPLGNGRDGVLLNNAQDAIVGGVTPGARNLISSNRLAGVEILGAGSTGVTVIGNFVGTRSDGLSALGNGDGIIIDGASRDVIGGTVPGAGNVISGNVGSGVRVVGAGPNTILVQGNRIGTDFNGLGAVGNAVGVFIQGGQGVIVGGTTPEARNLISGNEQAGVYLFGSETAFNTIIGNDIGVDASGGGTFVLPVGPTTGATRQGIGVLINDAPANVVGGSTAGSGNLLSGNLVGVYIAGFNATGNVIQGNDVGVDRSGSMAVPNVVGVFINNAPANLIGGPGPGAGNLVSGNEASGIQISGVRSRGNVIQGNLIGTDRSGRSRLPNLNGIYVENAPGSLIGGPSRTVGNHISGNRQVGIYLFGADSTGNQVRGNFIGTRPGGKGALGNGQYGILLFNAPKNSLGGPRRQGNVIRGDGIAPIREFTGPVPNGSARRQANPATLTSLADGLGIRP